MTTPVRAAGVVLWRPAPPSPGGAVCEIEIEIAVIHRPAYDDWSLPKGKLKPGEDFTEAAVRETREETGMDCALGPPLLATNYLVQGRPKEVHYWAARAASGRFQAGREVDRLEWLAPSAARQRLTHPHDRPLVDALLRALAP